MTQARPLPLSGYSIEKIYAQRQLLEHKSPGEEQEHGRVNLGWDWRILKTPEPRFEVRLQVTVEPSPQRDDYVSASVVGRFKIETENPTVALGEFVRFQAIAILMPYARQILSSLTSASFYGTFYLPSINVAEVMKDFDFAKSTGASQLQSLGQQFSGAAVAGGTAPPAESKPKTKLKDGKATNATQQKKITPGK